MSKEVLLIRHGKSSWDDPELADCDRPLAPRGVKDCKTMANYHNELLSQIDICFCSTAVRARQTHELLKAYSPGFIANVVFQDSLYTFDWRELISEIASLDDDYQFVALVGHNPAITELVNQVADTSLDNVATAGFVHLVFTANSWQYLVTGQSGAVLNFYTTPKLIAI